MCQITLASCQQHTALVTSCCHLGAEGKPSEELLQPMPFSVLPRYVLGLQVNVGCPHRQQKAGLAENLSKVPGLLQAALYQCPTAGGPSHSGLISHPARTFASSPIPMLVDSQTVVTVHNRRALVRVSTNCTTSLRLWIREKFVQRGIPIGPPQHTGRW